VTHLNGLTEQARKMMNDIRISTYSSPRWESKVIGSAMIRKDSQERYYVDNVGVADMRTVGFFTVITCVDNATHYVLTAFLHLTNRIQDTG
jgi:hypothetical protein